jgi:hypothetical protein
MLPLRKLRKACVGYKDTRLAFFAGDASGPFGLGSDEVHLNLGARNICVDVQTAEVHVRPLASPIRLGCPSGVGTRWHVQGTLVKAFKQGIGAQHVLSMRWTTLSLDYKHSKS